MTKTFLKAIVVRAAILVAVTTPVFGQSADWQKQVCRLLSSKQTYPRMAQMRGEEGTAKVKIYVGADVSVQRTELVAPSGFPTLDNEALALPLKAGTLPAPPGGATSVTLPFTWKLI